MRLQNQQLLAKAAGVIDLTGPDPRPRLPPFTGTTSKARAPTGVSRHPAEESASETAGSAAQPAEGRRQKVLLASPFDVLEREPMWHFATQQWYMGPAKPAWPTGWYYSWPYQRHVWHESSAAAQASVQAEPGGQGCHPRRRRKQRV